MISIIFRCVVFIFLFSSASVFAAAEKPRWSLEMNMSLFEPEDENWSNYYGSKRMPAIGASIAYRILGLLDLGMSIDYAQDRGTGTLPISGIKSGSVIYSPIPLDVFAILRLRFSDKQWVVPYGGGGYTRFSYYQSIAGQDSTRGGTNGYHARAGLQFLLDPLDESAAKEMLKSFGAINSYLYMEVKRTRAKAGTPAVQLGGYSYKSGLMIEFR